MTKGGDNERQKCKDISLWWSEGLNINPPNNDIFWRTNSGARATTRAKQGKTTANQYGDLVVVDPIGEPLLRCTTWEFKKGYNKDLDILSMIDSRGSKQLFKQFWKQVSKDAENAAKAGWGAHPILVIHRDRRKSIIIISDYLMRDLYDYCGMKLDMKLIIILERDRDLHLFLLEDFFQWCNPQYFVQRWENRNASNL
jgi:hypothetical protein